jgi:L-asparaginase
MRAIKYTLTILVFIFLSTANILTAKTLPTVAIITTGGTIAMKVNEEKKSVMPALSGEDLLNAMPELKNLATIKLIEFSNIDSSYMTPNDWLKLSKLVNTELERKDIRGVVITHGTDTMEETAYFLDLTVKSKKPVVLVGAQRNASIRDSDGPRNLLNAVKIVTSSDSYNKGVMVSLNQYINAARVVRKTHTNNVQTFDSGEYGSIGYVDDDRVIFYNVPLRRQYLPIPQELPRVDIISMYTGATGDYIKYAADSGAKGIVLIAFGMGNVNKEVYEAVKYAVKKNVYVVITTRVYYGSVKPEYGALGGGASLKEIGALFGDDLTPAKARILLMLSMCNYKDKNYIQNLFYK